MRLLLNHQNNNKLQYDGDEARNLWVHQKVIISPQSLCRNRIFILYLVPNVDVNVKAHDGLIWVITQPIYNE